MRVDLDHVGHRYADGPLLFHDLTASLVPGHVYALTGPSGAGKSTLLGIIAGVFCQVVIGQCGVSFPSEKAVGFSPVRNWPVIARVLLFHCIRA